MTRYAGIGAAVARSVRDREVVSSNLTSPTKMRIILASKSPARARLLAQLGLKFEVIPSLVDEDQIQDPLPSRRVKKLALLKAKTVLEKLEHEKNDEITIIAADTLVYLPKLKVKSQKLKAKEQKAKFIGKPHNLNDAGRILRMLSGKTHYLYSGFCVLKYASHLGGVMKEKVKIYAGFEKTKMTFRKLKATEIDNYVKTQNVLLFAGSYSIETNTPGVGFIKKIEGSKSNVVGLPMEKLREILRNWRLYNFKFLIQPLSSSLYK